MRGTLRQLAARLRDRRLPEDERRKAKAERAELRAELMPRPQRAEQALKANGIATAGIAAGACS